MCEACDRLMLCVLLVLPHGEACVAQWIKCGQERRRARWRGLARTKPQLPPRPSRAHERLSGRARRTNTWPRRSEHVEHDGEGARRGGAVAELIQPPPARHVGPGFR